MLEDDRHVPQEPRSRPVNAKFVRRQRNDDTWRVGVFLRVRGNGEKIWVQHIRVDGHPRKVILGNFPDLSMPDARKAAAENQTLVDTGGDLMAKQRQENTKAIRARLDKLTDRIRRGGSASPEQMDVPMPAAATVTRPPKTPKSKAAIRASDDVKPRRRQGQKTVTPPTAHNAPNHPSGTTQITSRLPEPSPTQTTPKMSEATSRPDRQPPSPGTQDTAQEPETQYLRDEARAVGPNVLALIEHILNEDPKSVIGRRRCEGILALKHNRDTHLDDVCAQALDAGDMSLTGVMSRMQAKHSQDLGAPKSDPSDMAHANIRGADYFY